MLLQEKTISQLQKENDSLKEEIESLKFKIELEESIPKEGFENAKELIEELTKERKVYRKLIEELKTMKQKYQDKMYVLSKETKERNKEIDGITKLVKHFAI